MDAYKDNWNAKNYLRQYYSTEYLADDDRAIFEFMTDRLRKRNQKYSRAIDFGCGPTLHHVVPLLAYVDEIHLADYLPENLHEISKWLNEDEDAHNWDLLLEEVFAIEKGFRANEVTLDQYKQDLRTKVRVLKTGNIYQDYPLRDEIIYELVTSFFCVEAVAASIIEWHQQMQNLCRLLAPGGTLIMASVRNCTAYEVMGKSFRTVCINEDDFTQFFEANHFDMGKTEVKVVQISEWVAEGFSSICIVKAEKLAEGA